MGSVTDDTVGFKTFVCIHLANCCPKIIATGCKNNFLVLILDHLNVSTASIPFNSKISIPQEMIEHV
jgi:hypothetical protein